MKRRRPENACGKKARMNSDLKRFLNAERGRVIEPGPDFAARVVAQAAMVPSRAVRIGEGIWDVVPVAVRPVFALAMGLLLAFFVIQAFVPVAAPGRGLISSY